MVLDFMVEMRMQKEDICLIIVNTLAPPTPFPSKPTIVNPTTIPNPNRLSAMLMSVDEGEGSELR